MEKLLAADPGNSEYEGIRIGLLEVIELTKDLLPSADHEESPNYQLNGLDKRTRGQEVRTYELCSLFKFEFQVSN